MKNVLLILLGVTIYFLVGWQPNPKLETGQWTGSLSPMNHPEMKNPLTYAVSYNDERLKIGIIGPNKTTIKTENSKVENDTLYFSFVEPEERVLLNCALGKYEKGGFAGKCIDSSGKWALFRMLPPL